MIVGRTILHTQYLCVARCARIQSVRPSVSASLSQSVSHYTAQRPRTHPHPRAHAHLVQKICWLQLVAANDDDDDDVGHLMCCGWWKFARLPFWPKSSGPGCPKLVVAISHRTGSVCARVCVCFCVSVCMAFNIYSAWNIFIIFFSFRLLQRLTNGFAACGFSYCSVGCCSCCSWCLVRWLLATLLFSAIWPLTIDQANPWRESAQRFFQRFIYLFRFNASWLHCVPTTYSSMSMSKSVSISCSLSLPLYRSRSLAPRFREVVLSHW